VLGEWLFRLAEPLLGFFCIGCYSLPRATLDTIFGSFSLAALQAYNVSPICVHHQSCDVTKNLGFALA